MDVPPMKIRLKGVEHDVKAMDVADYAEITRQIKVLADTKDDPIKQKEAMIAFIHMGVPTVPQSVIEKLPLAAAGQIVSVIMKATGMRTKIQEGELDTNP